ncbi:DUF3800 domain-containing protein [Kribbella sp. NPDC006257]|uniref:DUF3800 domain-containing protein n=1 Tax=Kribbella sp. NPDC006257 TaxID=3156738 RepID=UPI0033AD9A7F
MEAPVEIACDESGYEGEKLIGGVTDVFAHAAVRLDEESAARCIKELRERIRSPATEYKANHVLRSKHRPVLIWLLGPSGPLLGQAHVQLVDKTFFLISRLVGQRETANTLYAAGASAGGPEWDAFLAAANTLLRTKEAVAPIESFDQAVANLNLDGLETLRPPYADQARAALLEDPLPPLDPLLPAIIRATQLWGDGRVLISHDRQTTLSPDRIAQLKQLSNLEELELVDSFSHPRVQVADFLAGVARKIASDQLKGTDDAELTTLLRPYVDPLSTWSDHESRSRLTP